MRTIGVGSVVAIGLAAALALPAVRPGATIGPASPTLVHDFYPGLFERGSIGPLHVVEQRLFFTAVDRARAARLWISAGSPETTHRLDPADLEPRETAAFVTAVGDRALWSASHGRRVALWATGPDGESTRLNATGFRIETFRALGPSTANGRFYYQVCAPTCAIWSTDGTASGTRIEAALGVPSWPDPLLGALTDRWLVYRSADGIVLVDGSSGEQRQVLTAYPRDIKAYASEDRLYLTDSWRLWTWRADDVAASLIPTPPNGLQIAGWRAGRLYFRALEAPTLYGDDRAPMWSTAGSERTTHELVGAKVPAFSELASQLGSAGGVGILPTVSYYSGGIFRIDDRARTIRQARQVCRGKYGCFGVPFAASVRVGEAVFSAWSGRIYRTDARRAGLLPFTGVQNLTRIDGHLVFNEPGGPLLESDGTVAGTHAILGGETYATEGAPVSFAGGLAVAATKHPFGSQVWLLDQAMTKLTSLARFALGINANWAGQAGNTAVLRRGPYAQGLVGVSPAGTEELPFGAPGNVISLGSRILFGNHDHLLTVSDGTALGSRELHVSTSLPACNAAVDDQGRLRVTETLARLGARVVAFAVDGSLWSSDGTDEGTACFAPMADNFGVFATVPAASLLYFLQRTDESSSRGFVWRTDGTARGTFRLGSFPMRPYAAPNVPTHTLGDRLYFVSKDYRVAWDSAWESDGTRGGTRQIEAPPGTILRALAVNDTLLFARAEDPFQRFSLWVRPSSGGPWKGLREFAGPLTDFDLTLGAAGRVLFFRRFRWPDPGSAPEIALWRTDGTVDGTSPVPGAPEPVAEPDSAGFVAGGRWYFQGCERATGCELWSVDLEGRDPRIHGDLWPGPRSSDPRVVGSGADSIYFSATNPEVGREVWSIAR